MLSRRLFLLVLLGTPSWAKDCLAQGGVYLSEKEAAAAVFPEATSFARKVIDSTEKLRERMKMILGRVRPSIWEEAYPVFTAKKNGQILGYAVIVEEIGKHRPITFVVGVGLDNKAQDVAVMVYREAYGGEVRYRRFLKQYSGRGLDARLLAGRDIRNIAGATLSVDAIGRGVKKALALIQAVYGPKSEL